MVLFVVVIVVTMLSLAGLNFVSVMYTENKAVRLGGDELQIDCLVYSGTESIKAFCEQTAEQRQSDGGGYDNPNLFSSIEVLDQNIDGRRGRFSVISPRVENGEITGIRFGIQNESARLNLAVLPLWEEEHAGAARQALMGLPGMTESIADAVLDWIDDDDSQREFGAETDYYLGSNVPYGPRNTTPTSLEELLLVRDVTREMLFGSDANYNHRVDPEESQQSGPSMGAGFSGSGLPWASLLTVFSTEQNLDPDGEEKIYLNSEDLPLVYQALNKTFDKDWARFIIAYRQFGPYDEKQSRSKKSARSNSKDKSKKSKPGSKTSKPAKFDLALPAKFNIDSVLDLIGAEVAISSGDEDEEPVILESPLADDPAQMRDYLPALLDYTDTTNLKVHRGRVNVNLAPRAVLQGVPGVSDVLVERIANARASLGDNDPNRRHPTWILTEGLVDLDEMRTILPYLTCGGDVFRAQVVGYFDEPGAAARAEVVIDATSNPPRQVYWKDLRLLGPGYQLDELGSW